MADYSNPPISPCCSAKPNGRVTPWVEQLISVDGGVDFEGSTVDPDDHWINGTVEIPEIWICGECNRPYQPADPAQG